MSDEIKNGGLASFLLGAVAGGLIALLLSPGTGADNRKKLRRFLDRVSEELGDGLSQDQSPASSDASSDTEEESVFAEEEDSCHDGQN